MKRLPPREPAAVRLPRRPIDGVLLLDKPSGISSNAALQRAKFLLRAEKAGHTGTLDPLATGLLPVCLGEATKFSAAMLDAGKSYLAVIQFGERTTTGDADGEVLERRMVDFSERRLREVVGSFQGSIQQIPPAFSALKHQGKPLYDYARQGITVEREARTVEVDRIELEWFDGARAQVVVDCSKGTYIRVLAEDIGAVLGCGAHLAALRRTRVGHLLLADAVTLEQLEALAPSERDDLLLPVDCLLNGLPQVSVALDWEARLLTGQAVAQKEPAVCGTVRLYGSGGRFIGLGISQPDGKLVPKRLLRMVA